MKRILALPLLIALGAIGYAVPTTSMAMTGTVCTHIDATYSALGGQMSASLVFACPGTLGNKTIPQIYAAGYRVAQVVGPFFVASKVNPTTGAVTIRGRFDVIIEKP